MTSRVSGPRPRRLGGSRTTRVAPLALCPGGGVHRPGRAGSRRPARRRPRGVFAQGQPPGWPARRRGAKPGPAGRERRRRPAASVSASEPGRAQPSVSGAIGRRLALVHPGASRRRRPMAEVRADLLTRGGRGSLALRRHREPRREQSLADGVVPCRLAVPVLVDPAGRQVGVAKRAAPGDEPVERERGLDAADLGLVERAPQAVDRRVAVRAVDHELRDQVVVVGRHALPRLDARCRPGCPDRTA